MTDPNVTQNIKNEKARQQMARDLKMLRKIQDNWFKSNPEKRDPKYKRGSCDECNKPLFQSGQRFCSSVCFDIFSFKKKYPPKNKQLEKCDC